MKYPAKNDNGKKAQGSIELQTIFQALPDISDELSGVGKNDGRAG